MSSQPGLQVFQPLVESPNLRGRPAATALATIRSLHARSASASALSIADRPAAASVHARSGKRNSDVGQPKQQQPEPVAGRPVPWTPPPPPFTTPERIYSTPKDNVTVQQLVIVKHVNLLTRKITKIVAYTTLAHLEQRRRQRRPAGGGELPDDDQQADRAGPAMVIRQDQVEGDDPAEYLNRGGFPVADPSKDRTGKLFQRCMVCFQDEEKAMEGGYRLQYISKEGPAFNVDLAQLVRTERNNKLKVQRKFKPVGDATNTGRKHWIMWPVGNSQRLDLTFQRALDTYVYICGTFGDQSPSLPSPPGSRAEGQPRKPREYVFQSVLPVQQGVKHKQSGQQEAEDREPGAPEPPLSAVLPGEEHKSRARSRSAASDDTTDKADKPAKLFCRLQSVHREYAKSSSKNIVVDCDALGDADDAGDAGSVWHGRFFELIKCRLYKDTYVVSFVGPLSPLQAFALAAIVLVS